MITTRSPVHRIGGKFFLSSWITEKIPEHTLYCEPFAGAAHLLFAKELSPCEILNDIDGNLINFFKVLQDSSKRQGLIDTLNLMPYAREQWQEVRDRVRSADKGVALTDTLTLRGKSQKRELIESKLTEHPELSDRQIAKILGVSDKTVGVARRGLEINCGIPQLNKTIGVDGRARMRRSGVKNTGDVKKAADWFFLNKSCFSGDQLKGGFACPSTTGRNPAQSFRSAIDTFGDIARRLKNVTIECLDFKDCIQRYDSPDTLFFVDPPYLDAEHYYSQGNFALDDHYRLSDLLHEAKGKVMITHYQNALYDGLYPNWQRYEFQSFKGSHKAGQGATKPETIEVLYTNFTPELKTRSLFNAAQL